NATSSAPSNDPLKKIPHAQARAACHNQIQARHHGRSTYCLFITAVTFLVWRTPPQRRQGFWGRAQPHLQYPVEGKYALYMVSVKSKTLYIVPFRTMPCSSV